MLAQSGWTPLMDVKTNRAQDQKSWRIVGNQDSTVKGHIHKLTPFEFQSRGSKLKYSRLFSQAAKTAPTHHLKPVPGSGLRLPLDQGGNTWQAPGEARVGFDYRSIHQGSGPQSILGEAVSCTRLWHQPALPRQWPPVHPGKSPNPGQLWLQSSCHSH